MKVEKLNNSTYLKQDSASFLSKKKINKLTVGPQTEESSRSSLAFKGKIDKIERHGLLILRKLSNYMEKPSEMTNAIIAFIGTSAIAPFAIMYSPKKKDPNITPKEDKEKKLFQALRQIPSALLAFGFQMPTTIGIGKGLDYLAYKKQIKIFDDEILGKLIPSKKYLTKQAKQVLKGSADEATMSAWSEQLKIRDQFETLKPELIKKIKQDYEEVGLKISDEELEKLANKESTKIKFIAEKMAKAKEESFILQKVEELKGNTKLKIEDIDLVTSDYQDLARTRYKEEFAELRKSAKLSKFDKFVELIGFSNKHLEKLAEKEKKLAQEKGLELMRTDSPEIFKDGDLAKLKKYIENRNFKAQKLFGNKIFWLTLVTNLFMVGISCIALNALHPKFADIVDRYRQKQADKKAHNNTKVEVGA